MAGFLDPQSATLQNVTITATRPRRGIYPDKAPKGVDLPGPILAQATVEEAHHDEMEIVDHPIENGAAITDHAFKRPAEVTLRLAWSNSPNTLGPAASGATLAGTSRSQVAAIYEQLRYLQAERILCTLYTGKRGYDNMLLKSLAETTNSQTENALFIVATFRQLIIVSTSVVQLSAPANAQRFPTQTQPTASLGAKALQAATNYSLGAP
jgi:hypothetical protein